MTTTDPSVPELLAQIEQLKNQQSLQTMMMQHIIQGKWDAAANGADSAEAALYALNPTLQGQISVLPFVEGA
jgi:hypothetical protein